MRARSWVIQILYLWDVQRPGGSLADAMNTVLNTRNVAPERIPLIAWYVAQLTDHLDEVDRTLDACMDNWRLERLSRVDRAVLRTATAEILFSEDVPPKVAIQEGIRLAGQYGGSESPRFVNGVLDAVYRSRREPRSDA
jgi:N utilization substance protein B